MALPADRLDALRDLAVVWDLPITVIGQLVDGPPEVKLRSGGVCMPCPALAHDHFRFRKGPESAS